MLPPRAMDAQQAGERVAADVVDGAGPALGFERTLRRRGERGAIENLAGAELAEIVPEFGAAAGGGGDFVSQMRQDGDGGAAHAAGGSGDDDFASAGLQAVIFESHHALHGGEAGCADAHGLLERQTLGQRHDVFGVDAGELRVAAPEGFRSAAAGDGDFVAGLEMRGIGFFDHAGQIDAGNHGKGANHAGLAGDGEAVFVVQAGVGDADQHFASGQRGAFEVLDGNGEVAVFLRRQKSFKSAQPCAPPLIFGCPARVRSIPRTAT